MNERNNNTVETNSFVLRCNKGYEFTYTLNTGVGWSRKQSTEKAAFEKDKTYTFEFKDPAIYKNILYCKELDVNFKILFIMKLRVDEVFSLKLNS